MESFMPKVNFADFAQAAYDPHDDFQGYNLSKKYSSPDRSVWIAHDNSHAILSFKGTDPKNMRDVGTDILLGAEMKSLSTRFQHAEDITNILVKKYGKHKVFVTGHSLGGSQAMHVSNKFGVHAEAYNPFVQWSDAETKASYRHAVVHWNVGDPIGFGIPFIKTKQTRYHYNWHARVPSIGLSQHAITNLTTKNRRKNLFTSI